MTRSCQYCGCDVETQRTLHGGLSWVDMARGTAICTSWQSTLHVPNPYPYSYGKGCGR